MDFAAKNETGGSRWGIKMAFFLLLLFAFVDVRWGRRRGSLSRHKLEIKSHLRSLNKSAANSIRVSPDLCGDNNTRLFTYWTSDAYQATGCYNLICSGFIQISNEIAMGASIYPPSSYSSSRYNISILIWKDPTEENWWMQFGNGYVLGYWPAFLFSYLASSASMIEWGGEVVNSESGGRHTATEMGSGHFPEEGFGKAGYFRNIQYVGGSNNLRIPRDIGTLTEQPNCYEVRTGKTDGWGSYFFYGGPGRNHNCP